MGASFNTLRCKPVSREELKRWYEEQIGRIEHEHGHDSYSGTLGTCRGFLVTDKVFKTYDEAYDWLRDNTEKWEEAKAVQVGDFSKEFPRTKADKDLVARLEDVQRQLENFLADIVKRAKQGKSKTRGCANCGSAISVKHMMTVSVGVQARGHYLDWRLPTDCIVCGHNLLLTDTDKKRREALQKKEKELQAKVDAAIKKSPPKAFWLIGGTVAS